MPITNYNDLIDGEYHEGQLIYANENDVLTGYNDTASTILIGGRGVTVGSGHSAGSLPLLELVNGSSLLWAVIVAPTMTVEKRTGYSIDANGDYGWPVDYNAVPYILRGIIAVKVTTDVLVTDTPHCIHTADPGEAKGQWRANANTNKATASSRSRFLRPGSAGTVVPLMFQY